MSRLTLGSSLPARNLAPRLAALVACMAIASPTTPALAAPSTAAAAVGTSAGPTALPFDLPSTEVLRASSRKAFAHYIPSFLQSFDNAPEASDYYTAHYLNPNGEGGKHAAYGGFVRDRPLGRLPWADSAWELRDMEAEVRQAVAAGLDGFSFDLLQLGDSNGSHWQRAQRMLQAANNVDPGFKIMLMPDMTGLGDKDPLTLARYVAELGRHSSAYRLADGRLVVSPFYAEAHDAAWWKQFLTAMRDVHGTTVAFLPVFLNEQPHADAFAPISYGMSNWGNRNPAGNDPTQTWATSPAGRIAKVHALGQKWMAPVSVQDERPRHGIYDEAANTTNLRNSWQIAIRNNAELVQLPTWNDYAEGTQIAPSQKHGWSFLDISAYYLTQWKTGAVPATTRDTVYLTHRTQPVGARPSFPQTTLMNLRGGSTPARDTVEALTFLTAAATVEVRVGTQTHTCSVPAGPGTCTVPLSPGTVSARVVRGGTDVTAVTSPYAVTSSPSVQDLQYVAVSSGRSGTRAVAPPAADVTAPSAPGTPVASVSGTTVSLSWTASTDAVGVTGYEVHRSATAGFTPGAASLLGRATATTWSSAAPSGTWHYRVVAQDAAGNASAASAATSVTVPAPTPTGTTAPAGSVVSVAPVEDTYAHEWVAGGNFGWSSSLTAYGTPNIVSYLRFAVPATPAGKRLTAAALRLRTNSSTFAGSTGTTEVRLGGDAWTEGTTTWNDRPALGTTVLGRISTATTPSTTFTTPLDRAALASRSGLSTSLSLSTPSSDDLWVWSKDHPDSSYRPALELTYAQDEAPSVPGQPSATVSGTSVSLSWAPSSDDVGVSGYEVHRSSTSGFVPGPATLVATVPGTTWSTSTATPGAWSYRVVARDGAGGSSPASAQVAVTVLAPVEPAKTVVTLSPVEDTYAHEWVADGNFGTSGSLTANGAPNIVSFLRFALPSSPAGKRLTGATLRFRTSTLSFAGSSAAVDVKLASDAWNESTVTWNRRPGTGTTLVGRITTATNANTSYTTPLSVGALAPYGGKQASLSLSTTSSDDLWLWSKDHPDVTFRPVLVLTYS